MTFSLLEITILMFNVTRRTLTDITLAYLIILDIMQSRCRALQLRTYCSG
jgi:hypothetical protein